MREKAPHQSDDRLARAWRYRQGMRVALAVLAGALSAPATAGAEQFTHTFDASSQGWQVISNDPANANNESPTTWNAAGGNPGGYISVKDAVAEDCNAGPCQDIQVFSETPVPNHGNYSFNYGGTISYDVKADAGPAGAKDFVLFILLDGTYIAKSFPTAINTSWATHTVTLEAAAGWTYCTTGSNGRVCSAATKEQMKGVLLDHAAQLTFDVDGIAGSGETYALDNITLAQGPDGDSDGAPDAADNCPNLSNPGQADYDHDGLGDACDTDDDNDGVLDGDDSCPTLPIPSPTDTDHDGMGDLCDPDIDNDGVPNETDDCDTEVGPPGAKGCPDADGDGVADSVDECNGQAGTAATHGCPDSDGDGLPDKYDACPTQADTVAQNGCPPGSGGTSPEPGSSPAPGSSPTPASSPTPTSTVPTPSGTAASGSVPFAGVTFSRRVRLDAEGRAPIKVTCPAATAGRCTGTLSLTRVLSVRRSGKKVRKTETLGSARFTIAPGRTATVRVTIKRRARAKKLKATAKALARDADGTAATRRGQMRLTPARRRSR